MGILIQSSVFYYINSCIEKCQFFFVSKIDLKESKSGFFVLEKLSSSRELIEETRRPSGLTFDMWGYLWPGSDTFEFWKNFYTFDGVMTETSHFEGVKIHINAYISHHIRDRNVKT